MLGVASAWLFCAAWISDGGHDEDWRLPAAATRTTLAEHGIRQPTVRAFVNLSAANGQCSGRYLVVTYESRARWRLTGAGAYRAGEIKDEMFDG
jgi:hypothetical protein